MYMQTNIVADCHSKTRGYHGADLDLPAGPYEIEDALQRAHVPEGGGYVLEGAGCWPVFLWAALWGSGPLSGGNALGELNLLADAIGSMDREQIAVYEGAVQLELKEKGKKTATLKELINLAFCLDDYTFYPGVVSDCSLGKACMKGTMRERPDLLDDMAGLTSPVKAGKMIEEAQISFSEGGPRRLPVSRFRRQRWPRETSSTALSESAPRTGREIEPTICRTRSGSWWTT